MEERMTLCNMAIEGGARCGYVNPDQTTFDYLDGRPSVPSGEAWNRATRWWRSLASNADAVFDDELRFDAATIAPTVTWGITPGQGIGVDEQVPKPEQLDPADRPMAEEAYRYMELTPGQAIAGVSALSVVAPMVASVTSKPPPLWPGEGKWPLGSRLLWFLAPSRWLVPPRLKALTKCFVMRDLSGVSLAARCALR
jgi:aconitase A